MSRLFLFARDRCDGREAVQEIGDFVAHHSERTKGIVTRSTKEWFTTARFAIETSGRVLDDPQKLPSVTPEYLRANVQRLGLKYLSVASPNRAAAIKATDALDPAEHCDHDLAAREHWDGAVELSSDRKLNYLG